MLKNNGKITIGKNFLAIICVVCLMVASLGLLSDNSYAADLDNNTADIALETSSDIKLENSQIENDILKADSQDLDEVLAVEHTVKGNTFSDIQKVVNSANSGDTIKLSGTYYANGKDNLITIKKKLTITSTSGATLDGQDKSSIFRIYEGGKGTVISNLKFTHGDGDIGSAIRVGGKNVVIDNCIFERNHCYLGGTVVTEYNLYDAENLIVQNCRFIENSGYHNNFENHSSAGALGAYALNPKIINCYFDSNWVKGKNDAFGGAIQVGLDVPNYKGQVIGCTFINNQAIFVNGVSHGGAGCVRNGVDYIDCVFINNTAGQGGALTFHASGNIVNCVFINNTADKLYGGALSTGFLYDSMVLNVNNCTFEGNDAPEGGAIQVIGLNVNINNSTFEKNYASKFGGAISVEAANVNIQHSNFEDNWVEIDGGAIFMKGVKTTVTDSNFTSNYAIPHQNNFDDGLGGALYINSTHSTVSSNRFFYNVARNGSALYFDASGEDLIMQDNVLYQNQAWVYWLPIYTQNIYYGDNEEIKSVIYGGNNIADFDNLEVSNAIYNAAKYYQISVNGQNPISGASDDGKLYQDGREYKVDVLLTVEHEDGEVICNNTIKSSYLGEVNVVLNDLRPGKYYVTAKHFEDTYYKAITNTSSFTVYPKIDNEIKITSDKLIYNFDDLALWTVNITNYGPNNATGVIVKEVLPSGLIYVSDTSNGLYDSITGILNVSTLDVGEKLSFNILTVINKTGEILNNVNISANEFDSNLTNNFDNQKVFVNPSADIEVIKTANKSNPNYHDLVNWTIVIRNNGPDIAHNVNIRDIIPKTLIPINISGNYNSKKENWEIDSLNVNEEVIYYIVTVVNATGLIENTVDANASEFDYDLSNNNDSDIIKVSRASDLSIIKLVNQSQVNYQDIVMWTLIIKNNGPNDATGVKVTDILPTGFTYINSTRDYDGDVIDIGNLTVGEEISVGIICRADITGNFTNFATTEGNEYDPNEENNEDNESITVNPACDLEIQILVNESNPKNGDLITWTVTVKNNGPDDGHEINVSEIIPDSLIWIEDDSSGDFDPQNGIWTIGDLDVDDEVELNIICRVNKTGEIINNVNVTGREFDYNLTNNFDNESIEVEPSANVNIIKIVNNTNPNYNDLIKWTVIVSNKGPDNATHVSVVEKIPEGLILLNSTVSKGIYDNDLWLVCCLEKDEVETLEIICRVNKTGVSVNNVTIEIKENDPDPEDNEANESIDVPNSVDIEVIHDVNNTNPVFGETINWIITIKNNGPDNATNVQLTDLLPDSLKYVGYESTKGVFQDGIWNIGNLNNGEVEYINITCVPNDLGLIVNSAEATAREYDWNKSNNQDDAEINVRSVADLSVEKLVSNEYPNYGEIITWTIRVSNNGPNQASNVVVSENIPEKLEFIKSSDDSNFNNANWYVGNLGIGQTKELTIQCKVIATGKIINTVDVVGDEYDPNMDNNKAKKLISVPAASDLSITKIATKYKYSVGDTVEYVIEVINNGPDSAHNIKVNEILDNLLKLKSFKVTKGKFNKFTGIWTLDSLGYGESAKLFIQAIATGTGIIKNSVSVISDEFDFDESNNKDFAVVDVSKKDAKSISDDVGERDNCNNDVNNDYGLNNGVDLSNHSTANPFALFILSLVFLASFLGINSKKR